MSVYRRVEISRSTKHLIPAPKTCPIILPIPLASGRPAATSGGRDSRAWGSRVQPWSGGRSVRVRACCGFGHSRKRCPRGGRAGQPSKLPSKEKTRHPETAFVSFYFSRLKPSRDTALLMQPRRQQAGRRVGTPHIRAMRHWGSLPLARAALNRGATKERQTWNFPCLW